MATRRARIKAIVNVPARRSKVNDPSSNALPPKSPVTEEIPSIEQAKTEDKIVPSKDVHREPKVAADLNEGIVNIADPHPCSGSEDCCNEGNSNLEAVNSSEPKADLQPECHSVESESQENVSNDATFGENSVKATSSTGSDSGPKEIASDTSNETLDHKRKSEVAPVCSPLKQRSRLFIRPSPKLDGSVRGRYPSGNRHKTLSESEDEPRNRSLSCTVDDSENPIPDLSSRTSRSDRVTDGPEASANVSVEKAVADNRKNGNVRSGRQRARNKENRASDARRRLWLQMKKGNGSAAPLDRSRLTMFDYIYYNPVSNPMRSSSESSDAGRGRRTSVSNSEQSQTLLEEQVDDPGEGNSLEGSEKDKEGVQGVEKEGLDEGVGVPAPRVKVGPDGELIVDEQSLVIETTGLKEGREDIEKGPALVETSSFTNYATYSKRSKGLEWSENETLRFYRALNVVGTDFSLMQNVLFPSRSRRDLKNKFKREERRNGSLVEKALRNPEIFSSVEELQTEFAKTASAEKKKEEVKKTRGRTKGEGPTKRKAEKEAKPAKKKKPRKWIVNGNESEGDSESESSINAPSKLLEFPESKTLPEVVQLPCDKVVTSSVDDDITLCSQEIVVTNNAYESESECSGVKEDSDGGESVSSESQFFSRVLVPTRSGRIPKRREMSSGQEQVSPSKIDTSPSQSTTGVVNDDVEPPRNGMKVIICSKEAEDTDQEPSKDPLAVELTRFPSMSAVGTDFVNTVEPGSLVVIATCSPDNPSRQVLQLFMVSPGDVEDGGGVLIPQNLTGGGKMAPSQENLPPTEFGSSTVVSVKNPSFDYPESLPFNSSVEEIPSCTLVVEDENVEKTD